MASATGQRLELVISWLHIWIAVKAGAESHLESKVQRHIDLMVASEGEKPVHVAERVRERIAFAKHRKEINDNIRRCQAYIDSVVKNSLPDRKNVST